MSYVKLTARPGTWFKAGTEVFHYSAEPTRRLTVEEWNECNGFVVLVRGTRVCEDNPNERGMGCLPGEEREDGECCGCNEFDVEIVEEAR